MYYLLFHIMVGLFVGYCLAVEFDTHHKLFTFIIGFLSSWIVFIVAFFIMFIDYKKRSSLQKEIDQLEKKVFNLKHQKEYTWTKDNYKEAEKMLLTKGSCLILKEGDKEIPVPNDLKKDFYAFVNKGLTSQENYDRIYHDPSRYIMGMYSPSYVWRVITNGF